MMSKKMAAISLSGDLPKKAPEREAYTASTSSAAEVQCNDAPLYWVDTDGQGCGDYHRDHFCTPDGKTGYGWNPKWGSISHYASNGRDAFQACCQCGGGSAPVSTRPATKCAHGYAYSHEGWWDNWHTLHSPYGKVKHEHFVSTTECAAECTKTYGCVGYTLFQNQVCWLYHSFGGPVIHDKSVACTSQTYQPPVTAAPPTYHGKPTTSGYAPPGRQPLPRKPAGTGNYPADIMTCGVTPALKTNYMDCELYNKISDRVQRMLEALRGIELWTSSDGLTTPYGDYAGCILRVAGHDFMDFKKDVGGGADGCVDFTDPDNNGLQKCLTGEYASYTSRPGYGGYSPSGYSYSDNRGLLDAYQDVCDSVSLADFFVIAAEAVMMSTRRLSLDVFVQPIYGKDPSWYVNNQEFLEPLGNNLPGTSFSPMGFDFSNGFMYGRTTRTQCPICTPSASTNCNTPLPAPEGGCAENKRVFIENLGMTWEETTAIMGVHTLGQAKKGNSGYDGWWSDVNNSQRMNNNYYISLAMKGWTPQTQDNNKSLWIRSDDWANPTMVEMMLDTDICLAHQSDTARNELEKKKNANGARFCCNWWKNESSALCGYRETGVPSTWSQSKCCDPPHTNLNGDISFTNCQSDPTQLSGIGADAVLKYAFNEFDWMVDFEKSWRKATSVGQHHGGLKMLRPKTNGRICNNGHQRDYRSQGHV